MGTDVRAALRSILVLSSMFALLGLASAGISQSADSNRPAQQARHATRDWGRLVQGRLRNGVRFAILPRQGSEPGAAPLMRNEGGFIAEHRPGERGLAHLIEHVAFHSPTTRSPGDLDHLRRLGVPLTLPAPNAGSTSWRETNYYLSTRTTSMGDLDALLTLFSEAASQMTLRPDAVDISRAEVVREMADKKLGNEIYASYIAAVAPGSPNDVIDAQNSDDVPTASVGTIRTLYHLLYRPQNMMIVVVGNVNAAEVKSLIERRFGNWKPAGPASRAAPVPTFRRDRISPVSFSARPDGRRTALMTVVMPTPRPPASRERQLRAQLMDLLVTRAINDRLAASQPSSPPGKIGMFIDNGEQGQRQIMLWDNFAAGQWRPAVAGLRQATCDLATAGFRPQDWAAAKRNLVADLERRVVDVPKVPNVELAKDLSHAVADGRDLIPPGELLRYARTALPRLQAAAGSKWWRRQWRNGVEHLRVEAPELAEVANPLAEIRSVANTGPPVPHCKPL